MRVLITGSSGQIGTNLALRLMERGDQVVGIDRRANAWTDKIDTRRIDLLCAKDQDFPAGPFDVVDPPGSLRQGVRAGRAPAARPSRTS